MSPKTPLPIESSSLLLRLPYEINQRILSHLLVSQAPIQYHRSLTGPYTSWWEIPKDLSANILFTCSAMFDIGTDTIYRHNAFAFNSPTEAHAFVQCPQTAMVRSIVLVIDHESAWYAYLRGSSNPDLSYSRDFAHHTIRSVEVVLGHSNPLRTVSTTPGATVKDICAALIEQHLHHPTWTRGGGMLRHFTVRDVSSRSSRLALALGLDAVLVEAILHRDEQVFENFEILNGIFGVRDQFDRRFWPWEPEA